ncbi:hypothetical protein Vadar_008146 [Vaccinium darrowii]|uniref:Uncharacterized protein n=1 Tax=Vaccinium darrowii TaxID=229202 RepID=A0ACB7YKL6_9ERIC|nr:hypothetical protein Vadar_008146 [Vaccinium darrowii]
MKGQSKGGSHKNSRKMVKAKGVPKKTKEKGGSSKKGEIREVLGREFWFQAPFFGGMDRFWQMASDFRGVGKGPPNPLLGVPEAVIGDELDPTDVYRFGIERGDYPFSNVAWKSHVQSPRAYELWVEEILDDPTFAGILESAQVSLAICTSMRANITRDRNWLEVMLSRWCPTTHTFVATWGESTPTLEDVCYLWNLNLMGEVNSALPLTPEQEKIVEALRKAKSVAMTLRTGYKSGGRNILALEDEPLHGSKGEGFRKSGYLAAFLTLWLSLHVFPGPPEGGVDPNLFGIAAILSTGKSVPLAPLFLGTLYKRLDLIVPAARLSKGRYDICTYVHTGFLGMFFYERFASCAPLPNEFETGQNECRASRWVNGATDDGGTHILRVRGGLASVIDDESAFLPWPYVEDVEGIEPFGIYSKETTTVSMGALKADRKSHVVLNMLIPGGLPCYVGGIFGEGSYNPMRVARQFGLDQGAPRILPSIEGTDVWRRYLTGEWNKDPEIAQAVAIFPGKQRVGHSTAAWREFWKKNLGTFSDFVSTAPDYLCLDKIDANSKGQNLCAPSTSLGSSRDKWAYSTFKNDDVLAMVDELSSGARAKDGQVLKKLPFADSPLAKRKRVSNDSGTSVQGFRKGGQMGRIFGDVGEGLDIPFDDLGDVGMLSEGPSGGGFTSNPSRQHGIGKQLRYIPAPSSTELLMDNEDEESLEDDDSANNCSIESDGSELESEVGERMECVVEREKSGNNELERGSTVGVVLASKEVVRPEDIDSSSSRVDGGESAPLMGTSVAQPSKNLDSAALTTSKIPFGFAAFGTPSSIGVRVAGDLVSSALGGGRGGLATPCRSNSEVVTDNPVEEMDGKYIVIRRDDGSVELKEGSESVVVKLEYFDSLKDPYRQQVLYIFRLHPSTFVGLGALSPMERKFVLLEFGVYLECLDDLMLSAARVEDFALLHKKLISLKNNGLGVQWLFDRNDHLVAQLEAAQWSDKVEQLEASLETAVGTVAHLEEKLEKAEVAHLEENLGEAKAAVVSLKKEKANCVEKHTAASKFAILDFDLSGSASQGLRG